MCIVGAALSAGPLAFGVVPAMAAKHKTAKPKIEPVATACTTNVGIMIDPGATELTPPVSAGHEYGSAKCGAVLGRGVQGDTFTVPDSGDTLATFTMYFRDGSIRGKYDLTPQDGSFNFTTVDYLGTMTVDGGSGSFFGAKGAGTMTCQSPDGIHTSCTDKLKLTKL